MLKTALLKPMPKARITIIMAVKLGLFRNVRKANLRFSIIESDLAYNCIPGFHEGNLDASIREDTISVISEFVFALKDHFAEINVHFLEENIPISNRMRPEKRICGIL